jgi:hypothetical protein
VQTSFLMVALVGSDLRADRLCGEVVGSGVGYVDGPLGGRTLSKATRILEKKIDCK